MKIVRRISMLSAVTALIVVTLELGVSLGIGNYVSDAQARVGRPLTPVSVAGVGRRTTRRCAAGVYNC